MAATVPFRVSNLIRKYGWEILPYLSNLGPTLLAEAQVLFVDSGATNALDADDGYHGHSFETPLATWDYAIGLCTAGERSVIFLAPGHNEVLGNAQVEIDVTDITTIGIGVGTNKPRVDFDHANSSVNIAANNTHIRNVTFMPSITDILVGVDVVTAVTGTIIEDCDFAEGESADDEFILGLDIKAGCSNTKVTNCLFRTKAAAAGCTHAVKLTGASDNVIIEKSRMIGNYSTAAIGGDTTLSTDVLIDDVTIKVKDGEPGIEMLTGTTGIIRNVCIESTGTTVDNMIVADAMSWFNNFGVTADGAAAAIIGGGEVNAQMVAHGLDHLVTLADGTDAYPASVVEDSILAKLISKDEPPATTSFDNTTDSLEAISDKIGASGGGIAYFVDNDNGDNANDGLGWDTAKADIDHAIGSVNGVVSNYDTVYVRGTGTYTESVATGTEVGVKIIGVGDGKLNPLWTSAAAGEVALTLNGQGWEVRNFLFHGGSKTASMIQVTVAGGGSVIENNYFHGGASSLSAVQYTGGSLQNKLIGNHITQFGATHGDSGNNYEAAVWGNTYNQSACDYEIRDNVFSDNTDHLKLQAVNCLIRGNTFTHDGYNDDAVVVIDLYCSAIAASNGNNIVVDNYFSHDSSELTVGNGYKFRDNDYIGGNHCIDGDSGGKPAGEAKAYYVDSDLGVDTNSGLSWGRAKLTIAAAVALVADHDTIYVRGATIFSEAVSTTAGITNVKIIGVEDSAKRRPNWMSGAEGSSQLTINSRDWTVRNFMFQGSGNTIAHIYVDEADTNNGSGFVIENCYFHGVGNSHSAIQLNGGVVQGMIRNNIFVDYYTKTHSGYEATIWGSAYTQSAVQVDIVGNTFIDLLDAISLQAVQCIVSDNQFKTIGHVQDMTTVINLVGAGSSGSNIVTRNTFDVDSSKMTRGNGFTFSSDDMIAGNHCLDGDSAGKPNGVGRAWYVDSDTGNDSNPGHSWGQAKLTIAAAVALCADFDTVYIRGVASFNESVVTTTGISNVKLIGVDNTKRRPEWRSAAQGSYSLQLRSLDWEVHNIRFSGNLTNTVCLVQVAYAGAYTGAGVLIKDCYFHGGGDSVGGIEFNGGGFQNDIIGCHFTDFGGAGAAGIWTTNHLNYFLHGKIVGNWFSENVNCLRINAQTCLVKDNVFQTEGAERDATVVCDLVNSGGSGCKGNCCVDNYFGDVTANIKNSCGYYGHSEDLWVNESADAKDYGYPTVA